MAIGAGADDYLIDLDLSNLSHVLDIGWNMGGRLEDEFLKHRIPEFPHRMPLDRFERFDRIFWPAV